MRGRNSQDSPGRRKPTEADLDAGTPVPTGGREVRVGVFVLAGLVSVLLALFLLTDPATFRGRYMIQTDVSDAGGVRSGDPVQMRGVNVGRVRRFTLLEEGVRISLEINGEWEIPADSRARVTGFGLLGGRTIEVVPGAARERLRDGDRILGESTEGISELADALGVEVEDILGRMQNLLSDPNLAAVQGTASQAEILVGELSALVEEQSRELRTLTGSLQRSARSVEGATDGPELARALARADSTLAQLNETGARLRAASGSLEEILGRVERGEGTLGRLSQDESLYRNLNEAAASFRVLAEDIRENPGRYVRIRIF
jgi:phospholipid/cholesterol/gamma-HCH transport system substrate-binding protein